jgi:hypothetical protein
MKQDGLSLRCSNLTRKLHSITQYLHLLCHSNSRQQQQQNKGQFEKKGVHVKIQAIGGFFWKTEAINYTVKLSKRYRFN